MQQQASKERRGLVAIVAYNLECKIIKISLFFFFSATEKKAEKERKQRKTRIKIKKTLGDTPKTSL
jgi:hypothetical protein